LWEMTNFVWESGAYGLRAIHGAELQVMQRMMRPRRTACYTEGRVGEVRGGFSLRPYLNQIVSLNALLTAAA